MNNLKKFKLHIQTAPFDSYNEIKSLTVDSDNGAVVSFIGLVRNNGDYSNIVAMELEHYSGMTEKCLEDIIQKARQRWPINAVTLIHRVGHLKLNEPIVLVVVASGHRKAAFAACEFLMDYLKTRAPFWKKEICADGESYWVSAKNSDYSALEKWD